MRNIKYRKTDYTGPDVLGYQCRICCSGKQCWWIRISRSQCRSDGDNSPEISAERMRTEIQKTKSLTNKPFGVSVLVNCDLAYTWPILEAVIDENVLLFM